MFCKLFGTLETFLLKEMNLGLIPPDETSHEKTALRIADVDLVFPGQNSPSGSLGGLKQVDSQGRRTWKGRAGFRSPLKLPGQLRMRHLL